MKLTIEQEAKMLLWYSEFSKGMIKGHGREMMYEIYSYMRNDRNSNVCKCLDPDTHKKVLNFIGGYDWSEEIRKTPRFAEILPHLALQDDEDVIFEIENNQPVKVDLGKVAKALKKKK